MNRTILKGKNITSEKIYRKAFNVSTNQMEMEKGHIYAYPICHISSPLYQSQQICVRWRKTLP